MLTAVAILCWYIAYGRLDADSEDTVPSWVVGYIAGPEDGQVVLVIESCGGWNLDETWAVERYPDRVELWIGWWSGASEECDAPQLGTLAFGLSEPLGDRKVHLVDGGEIPLFEAELPPPYR